MKELTQYDKINRIVYMWARYSGTRCPEGKTYSSTNILELIEKLEKYRKNPEKFDWDEGGIPEEEEALP